VSLSISQINAHLFGISSNKWHRDEDVWWCVLAFDPNILAHEGVVFSTTNNIYTSVVRGVGAAGLDNLFKDEIVRWGSNIVHRSPSLPAALPTCSQAEVLYPKMLSTSHMTAIYVVNDLHADIALAQLSTLGHRDIELKVDPMIFQEHPESG
jgi:ssDNA thymidine ADP-ribosyltransferase, DarT